jgi:hypothetical protein
MTLCGKVKKEEFSEDFGWKLSGPRRSNEETFERGAGNHVILSYSKLVTLPTQQLCSSETYDGNANVVPIRIM